VTRPAEREADLTDPERLVLAINGRLAGMSVDELRVINHVASRIERGRVSYGPLDIDADKRDWLLELDQELVDAVVYAAIERLKHRSRP
jgi:hypothetical protein